MNTNTRSLALYPLTEAAQDVPGTHANMQEYRDEQARRLYRHGCKMEGDRDALLSALESCISDLHAARPGCVRIPAYRAAVAKVREGA